MIYEHFLVTLPCLVSFQAKHGSGNIYHPQTKFAKVMFLHLSVSPSVHRGRVPGQVHPPGRYTPTPLGRYTPWAGTPPLLGRYTSPLGRYTPQAGTPRQVHPLGRYTSLGRYTPRSSACWEIREQADSTHPTGMHSCHKVQVKEYYSFPSTWQSN